MRPYITLRASLALAHQAGGSEDDHAPELEGKLEGDVRREHPTHLTHFQADPVVVLDIRADPAHDIGMEDDLVILLVEPESAGGQERLTVPRGSDMSHFRLSQKGTDPFVIPFVLRQPLEGGWVLIAIVAWHTISRFENFPGGLLMEKLYLPGSPLHLKTFPP